MRVAVTGGAGFIGSALIRWIHKHYDWEILNIDCLTYAGNIESLDGIETGNRYQFSQTDICNADAVSQQISQFQPDYIIHLAAESHVDRSIDGPLAFIETNVIGTYNMLQAALNYYRTLSGERKDRFRFHHVSTDEVYGSLGETGLFREDTPYQPNSPYSASKASSDHFVRAWHETYGLPVTVSNCSNNYGPYQFPEKLIPLVILNALNGKPLPVYGKGENIRDWLFVDDHVEGILTVLEKGKLGECYNIGGSAEHKNIDVVRTICKIMDELNPDASQPHENLIEYVTDRPGHDMRYAIDTTKIASELNWAPKENFESGLKKTVHWYLTNKTWWERIHSGEYRGERLGLDMAEKSA
ncbi:MAG: dTDP-glucose 4,6-dehydratase [Methyloligellaceae bacterium]